MSITTSKVAKLAVQYTANQQNTKTPNSKQTYNKNDTKRATWAQSKYAVSGGDHERGLNPSYKYLLSPTSLQVQPVS